MINNPSEEENYSGNIFEKMEKGFYEDLDIYDIYEVFKTCPGLGP